MNGQIYDNHGTAFAVSPLRHEDITEALALCDACVGANMYPRSVLEEAVDRPGRYFFLLRSPEGELAGYFYFFLTDLDEMAAFSKVSKDHLARMTEEPEPVLVNLRSLGIARPYRSCGLALAFMRWGLDFLARETPGQVAMGVFWKPNGTLPMVRSLETFSFLFLEDAHLVWYDTPGLVCPYCQGKCHCDAAVYYKPLKGGNQT